MNGRIILQLKSFSIILVLKKIYSKKKFTEQNTNPKLCVEDNPALNFVTINKQTTLKEEMNVNFEKMAIKIFYQNINRSEIVNHLKLDSTLYCFTIERFHAILFKYFPALEIEYKSNKNPLNELFYEKLF